MSKYCPLLNRRVVYLECNECEDKACNKKTEGVSKSVPVEESSDNAEEGL